MAHSETVDEDHHHGDREAGEKPLTATRRDHGALRMRSNLAWSYLVFKITPILQFAESDSRLRMDQRRSGGVAIVVATTMKIAAA